MASGEKWSKILAARFPQLFPIEMQHLQLLACLVIASPLASYRDTDFRDSTIADRRNRSREKEIASVG